MVEWILEITSTYLDILSRTDIELENMFCKGCQSLRKLAHAIYRDFLALKIEKFQLKNFDIFLIFAQNIDCGYTLEPPRRGGSNEYPQSMFWSKNKKNRYTPAYLNSAI